MNLIPINQPKRPTLRITIQEYNNAKKSYKGRKSYLVRLDTKAELKGWIAKFETLLREMEAE